MSFYVSVYNGNDTEKEITWLCGWNWSDFGRALLGDKDEGTLTRENFFELFDMVHKVLESDYYKELKTAYEASYENYVDYFYEVILGGIDFADNMDYDTIQNPQIATAVRRAYLEWEAQEKEKCKQNRIKYQSWVKEMTNGITDWYMQKIIQEQMESEEMMTLISFLIKVADYPTDKYLIVLG